MITIPQLTRIANDFLHNHYELTLDIPIKRNNRLKRAMGRIVYTLNIEGDYEANRIEIAGFMFDYAETAVVIDTLKHELVHYALDELGKPSDDGDPYFEAELKRLGVSSTDSTFVGVIHESTCEKCSELHRTFKPMEFKKRWYFCAKCRAPLTKATKRIYNGTEAV